MRGPNRTSDWMRLARILAVPLVAGELLVGCEMLVTEDQANAMGAQAYQEMLQSAKLSTDAAANRLVEDVGKRIAKVTDDWMAAEGRAVYQWEFKVIDDPKMVNAFALPGGKVAVYTGLLPVAGDADGLAVVMGHEVAHAYAQHGRKRVSQGMVAQLGMSVVEAFISGQASPETSQLAMAALGVGYQLGVELPFSRGDESEADDIGLRLMAEAGYDPRAAVPFWERMSKSGGAAGPEFLSTHPNPETRVSQMQERLPAAIEIYERSKSKK